MNMLVLAAILIGLLASLVVFFWVKKDDPEPQAYNLYDEATGEYVIYDKEGKVVASVKTPKEAIEMVNDLNNPENVGWWRAVCAASWIDLP